MDKQEWFELVELTEELNYALSWGDKSDIKYAAESLADAVTEKVNNAAEQGGWFGELENYIDTMTFAD